MGQKISDYERVSRMILISWRYDVLRSLDRILRPWNWKLVIEVEYFFLEVEKLFGCCLKDPPVIGASLVASLLESEESPW